jgi:hypothetical protein
MISDEMRELLSAYVDGELRDADAARIEDASKRDPELRREIEAYRTLRKKLREWDAAENGVGPSPEFLGRTLARARSVEAALLFSGRSRLGGPFAIAAALLLAVGVGYAVARATAPGAPTLPEPATRIAVEPLPPAPDVTLEGSAIAPPAAHPPELVQRMRIDDHFPSRHALELEEAMRREELVSAAPVEPQPAPPSERPTVTPISGEILAMIDGYATIDTPGALVLLTRPPALTALEAVQPATGRSIDGSGAQIISRLFGEGPAVLSPLGEVWTGPDHRTRIIAGSSWVPRGYAQSLDVVWGDSISTPERSHDVEVQDLILGPKARQRLLLAKPGPDAAFLAWLRETYGASLPARIAEGGRDRERAVNRLMDALGHDPTATGFAVFDGSGKLLGTELFRDHALMLAFAPRLLRGYLLEAGDDGIRLKAPARSHGDRAEVQDLLKGLPGRGLRIEREKLDEPYDSLGKAQGTRPAPEGVTRVTLLTTAGQPVAHGIVQDETPIHLTVFGE